MTTPDPAYDTPDLPPAAAFTDATAAVERLILLYDAAAEALDLAYIDFLMTFSGCWIAFFALVIFIGFIPAVNKKNSDIHTTRSMLLYLPVPVVARAPSILALVDDILARNSDQFTAAATSSTRVAPT